MRSTHAFRFRFPRTTPAASFIPLLVSALALVGCGDDPADTPDTGVGQGRGTDMGGQEDIGQTDPDMGSGGPVAVAACDRKDLVIAGLDLATSTLTLLNPTDSTITIDSSSPSQLCQGFERYSALPAPSPVVIESGETADFDLSGISNIDIDPVNGTLSLYSRGGTFGSREPMIDWMCWGDGGGVPRQTVAQMLGSDNTVLWDDGGCTSLGGATALYRDPASDGSSASHYVRSQPTIDCTAVPEDMGVTMDMGPPPADMGPPPTNISACDREDLVIHSLDTSTGVLTLLNPTDSDIIVDSSSTYRLCQGGPALYDPLPATTPVTVTAGGTATFDLSGLPNIAIDGSNGTLALYNPGVFEDRDAMLDWVCWGDGAGTPRLDVAMRRGSDNSLLWDGGACVPLSAPGAFFLDAGSAGAGASDYVDADPGLSCE